MEYWVAVLGATAVYYVPTFSTKVKWLRNTPFWSRAESSICTWILCVRHQGRSTQRGKAAALLRPIPLSRRCLTIRRFGEYPKWKFAFVKNTGKRKADGGSEKMLVGWFFANLFANKPLWRQQQHDLARTRDRSLGQNLWQENGNN